MRRQELRVRRQAEQLRAVIRSYGLAERTREWILFFGYASAPTLARVAHCARAAALDAFRGDARSTDNALDAIADAAPDVFRGASETGGVSARAARLREQTVRSDIGRVVGDYRILGVALADAPGKQLGEAKVDVACTRCGARKTMRRQSLLGGSARCACARKEVF